MVEAFETEKDEKSRSQKKREDQALQRLGEELVGLPLSLLETMDLPEELLAAVKFAHKVKGHGARRRQIRHIGALMRQIDPEPVQTALARIRAGKSRK